MIQTDTEVCEIQVGSAHNFLLYCSMIRVQKKIHHGLGLLQFFTTRNWVFRSQNFLNLPNDLNSIDKEIFCLDYYRVPMEKYMTYCILGARQYCMKEDLSSLPRCRILQKL